MHFIFLYHRSKFADGYIFDQRACHFLMSCTFPYIYLNVGLYALRLEQTTWTKHVRCDLSCSVYSFCRSDKHGVRGKRKQKGIVCFDWFSFQNTQRSFTSPYKKYADVLHALAVRGRLHFRSPTTFLYPFQIARTKMTAARVKCFAILHSSTDLYMKWFATPGPD